MLFHKESLLPHYPLQKARISFQTLNGHIKIVLKHAELESETRGVQGFGAKFGAIVAEPNSSKDKLKALIIFF